jgi:hypothetical protein
LQSILVVLVLVVIPMAYLGMAIPWVPWDRMHGFCGMMALALAGNYPGH